MTKIEKKSKKKLFFFNFCHKMFIFLNLILEFRIIKRKISKNIFVF